MSAIFYFSERAPSRVVQLYPNMARDDLGPSMLCGEGFGEHPWEVFEDESSFEFE